MNKAVLALNWFFQKLNKAINAVLIGMILAWIFSMSNTSINLTIYPKEPLDETLPSQFLGRTKSP